MVTNTTDVSGKPLSDAEIATRIAAGDQNAFVLLMRRFNRPLYRTARSILKDDTEAEDVLQEAYLLIFRGIKSYRGDARLLTWLTRSFDGARCDRIVTHVLERLEKVKDKDV